MGKLDNFTQGLAFVGALGAVSAVSSEAQALTREDVIAMQNGDARPVPWSVEGDGQVNICEFEGEKYMIFSRDPSGGAGRLQYVRCDEVMNCVEDGQVNEIQGLPGYYLTGFIYPKDGISKLMVREENSINTLEYDIRVNGQSQLEVFGDPIETQPALPSFSESFFTENGVSKVLWHHDASGTIRDLISGVDTELNGTLGRDVVDCGLPGVDSDTGLVTVGRNIRDARGETCEPFFANDVDSALTPIITLRDDQQYDDYSLQDFRSADDVLLFSAAPRDPGRNGRRILQYIHVDRPEVPVDAEVVADAASDAALDAATPDAGPTEDAAVDAATPDAGPAADAGLIADINVPPNPDAGPTPDVNVPPIPDGGPAPDVNVPPIPDGGPAPDVNVPPIPDGGPAPDVNVPPTPDAAPNPDAASVQPSLSPYEIKLIAGNCVKEVLGEVSIGRAKFTHVSFNGDGSQTCTVEVDPDGPKKNATLIIKNDKHGEIEVDFYLPTKPNLPVEADVLSYHTTVDNDEDPLGQHVNILNQGVTTGSAASRFIVTPRPPNQEGHRVFEVTSRNKPTEPKVFLLFANENRLEVKSDGKTYLVNIDLEDLSELPQFPECEDGDPNCEPIDTTPDTPPATEETGGSKATGCDCSIGGTALNPAELAALALLMGAPLLRRRRP